MGTAPWPPARRHRAALFWGVGGATLVLVALLPFNQDIDVVVPALLLLVPITLASARSGWKVAVPLSLYTAAGYALCFLPPIGRVRFGFTRDVATWATFLAVGLLVGLVSGRQASGERSLIDERGVMLLRSVSHDLRTPLHTIQAAASDLMRSESQDEQTRSSLLHVVADESRRLDRIVANMLSVGRIEAGALLPNLLPEYLPALLATAVARVRRSSGREISIDVAADVPGILADAVQVDQVLSNLLDNAVRHSPPDRPVTVSARCAGDRVEVIVADDGPGFEAAMAAIGPRPYRADLSGAGLGLGLVVCERIVEAHGGRLVLGNRRGGGAKVSFTLPAAPVRPVESS